MVTPSVDEIVQALATRTWSTAELVRLSYAVATLGKNTTSILGQYGEERTALAFGGVVASFDQKAYDVRSPTHGDLQVKTYSVGKRPGSIRSFTHDVVTVQVEPSTARVVSARLYKAADLYESFSAMFDSKYAGLGMAWGRLQADRFERGWTIARGVPSTDVTHLYMGSEKVGHST